MGGLSFGSPLTQVSFSERFLLQHLFSESVFLFLQLRDLLLEDALVVKAAAWCCDRGIDSRCLLGVV